MTTSRKNLLVRGLLAGSLLGCSLLGCVGGDLGGRESALSRPGPWQVPDETGALGDLQTVPYVGGGTWAGARGCSGGIEPGAQALRDWLLGSFPQVLTVGGYRCRPINGDGARMSLHATGRALDIMLPRYEGDADNDLGDPIGNYLIEHAEEIGIQYIIWDRASWNASRAPGSKLRPYGGAHPHDDHLHVELSPEAARMETDWFSGGMDPVDVDGCEPIAAAGGLVDDTSTCFRAFGNDTYWRSVSGTGQGGSLLWTNAFQSDSPNNWARWDLALVEGGDYAVEVSVPPEWGVHRATRYAIQHAGAEHWVTVDHGASDGWIRLGVFRFSAGGGQHVSVYDNVMHEVAREQHIAVDAVRLVQATPDMHVTDPGVRGGPAEAAGGGDPAVDDDPWDRPSERVVSPPPVRGSIACSPGDRGRRSGSALPLLLVAVVLLVRRDRPRRG